MNIASLSKLFLLAIIFLGSIYTPDLHAQRTCGSVHPMSTNAAHDPEVEKKFRALEKRLEEQIQQKSSSAVTVIPVVFHVIHDGDQIGSGENISDALIEAQLMQLNDDFRRMNADQDNTWNQASDTEIEFCLATIDPIGVATSGILRHNMQGGPWTRTNFNSNVKPQTIWNRDQYLNIWSADLAGDLLGYAQFPGEGAATDGVVCLSTSFGSLANPQSGGAPFNLGRTLTHEVGHWLNLYHIWGDVSGCGGSDEVADTPNQSDDTSGCPTGVQTDVCAPSGPGNMYQNYMDYTNDACMNLFTSDQKNRMKATIDVFRSGLNSSRCSASQPIIANFSPNDGAIEVCPDGQVQFTDMSTGPITNRMWTFSGAGVSPSNSSDTNPIVQLTSTGVLIATLTASNNSDSNIKQAFIDVTVLLENNSTCQVGPCLDFDDIDGGPYADLYYADGIFTDCTVVDAGFEVFSNEAYILTGLIAGTSYTFEFCNGYDANLWDAVITIGKYDQPNEEALPNSVLAFSNDCSITFTPTESDDYIAVVSTAGDCNGDLDQRDNGYLTFRCNDAPIEMCGLDFVDDGGSTNRYNINQNKLYTLCPNDTGCEKISLVFSEFELESSTNCVKDYMIIYDGIGVDKIMIDTYCGTNSPGTIISSASSGCLTIEFVSDQFTSSSDGWIARVICLDDGSCGNECPEGYSLSGIENGSGGPLNTGDYQTNGVIVSSQSISSGDIIYDAKSSICLDREFNVNPNTSLSIYLDGCATGSGAKK